MMKKIKIIIFIILVIYLFYWYNDRFNIDRLDKKMLYFNELPKNAQKILLNVSSSSEYYFESSGNIICLDKDKYTEESIPTIIGPWVAYTLLINTTKKEKYKIDYGTPSPYIIYDNYLYIGKKYNVLTLGTLQKEEFIRYKLRD